jgi:hypothetical protein
MWVIAKGELPNETTKSVDRLESYVCHFACGESSMKLGIAWLSDCVRRRESPLAGGAPGPPERIADFS